MIPATHEPFPGSLPEERRTVYRLGYRFVVASLGVATILFLMSEMPLR